MVSSPDKQDIVLTSRIRLARNLKDTPFPGWAKRDERAAVFERTMGAAKSLETLKANYAVEFRDLNQLQKQILVERHLVSRDLAARSEGCGVVVSSNKSVSIMLNEEDHLRLQYILPGEQLNKAWTAINRIDNELEARLPYAFHPSLGYLTACPTNLGTGMRASAMLHLPGLMLSGHMEQVVKASHELNLTVRGIYGEGTQGLGHLFQISNQMTLGEKEEDIISRLRRVIADIARQEKNARLKLYSENKALISDRIVRAYGAMKYSLLMPPKEALEHISMLRLGVVLGFFDHGVLSEFNQLVLEIQSAHLQYNACGKRKCPEVNDARRADVIRLRFQTIPEPSIAV